MSELISIGGRSLEKEDQFLQSVHARRGEDGGVLRVKLGCFYQYVFGRALLRNYDCQLRFEYEERCFAKLKVKFDRKNYFFLMENWKGGEPLTSLKEGVDRLAKCSNEAYLLVFSAGPYGQTEGNLHLLDGLTGAENRVGAHRFRTKDVKGEDYEFWIGGWHVPRKPSAVP